MDGDKQKSSTGFCGHSMRGAAIRMLNRERARLGMLMKAPHEFDSILVSEILESVERLKHKPTPPAQMNLQRVQSDVGVERE